MHEDHRLSAYRYQLPEALIAQHPAGARDESRLMVVDRGQETLVHRRFSDLAGLIDDRDMLVVNNTRVFPARLLGRKQSGGKIEVFLLEFPVIEDDVKGIAKAAALTKSSKRPRQGTKIEIAPDLTIAVVEDQGDGKAVLRLRYDPATGMAATLKRLGQVPLPPYIARQDGCTSEDVVRYQTVYANQPGAVAAPTAGLHFTDQLLESIGKKASSSAR